MALETATYVNGLVVTNPTSSDGLGAGDDHIRLLKSVFKNTFPNFSGAITATHTVINDSIAAVVAGIAKLSDSGAWFASDADTGVRRPAADNIALRAGGTDRVLANADGVAITGNASVSGVLAVSGALAASGAYGGGTGQLVPIGGTLLWWDDALPAEGGYTWANGGTISRTANPVLWARWGTKFGGGDGSTTFNVPDLRDCVPVGKSTMGGAAAAGRIVAGVTNFVSSTVGAIFGAAMHALTGAQNGPHYHDVFLHDPGHSHTVDGARSITGGSGGLGATPDSKTTSVAATGITIRDQAGGAGTANRTASAGTGEAHNNVQPSTVCNYIIRIG